jgi:hypothetical protein
MQVVLHLVTVARILVTLPKRFISVFQMMSSGLNVLSLLVVVIRKLASRFGIFRRMLIDPILNLLCVVRVCYWACGSHGNKIAWSDHRILWLIANVQGHGRDHQCSGYLLKDGLSQIVGNHPTIQPSRCCQEQPLRRI